jgi:Tfp pilus assembly protein PilF
VTSEESLKRFAELYVNAVKLMDAGKDAEANRLFFEAAKLRPDQWLGLSAELIKKGEPEQALRRLREVMQLTDNAKVRAAALNNIGMITANRGQNAEAVEAFEMARTLAPEFADTWSNLGLMRKWAGDFDEAIRYINEALNRDPFHEQAQFIRSMAKLLKGDYSEGFEEYECRWRSRANGLQKIATPYREWNGEPNRKVLVYGEQGHGDSLLVARYARLMKERNCRVLWVAQKSLSPLLRRVAHIDDVVEVGTELPDFDAHIPAVSLPRIFKTTLDTIPPAPYIVKPEPVDYGPGFHVGICWRGSKAQGNDLFRSTSLRSWGPVLELPNITLHSLQVDGWEEALVYPRIKTYETPKDWLETASRIAGLNLVLSVDTGIVHCCGAMGVLCLCALHCRPYFVFPPHLGEVCPWYPTVKLYRQKKEFEWHAVFNQIANDLCTIST